MDFYNEGNSSIEINQVDTIFKVNAGVESGFENGKNIVIRAGSNSNSSVTANGGNIILEPGTVVGSGTNGKWTN